MRFKRLVSVAMALATFLPVMSAKVAISSEDSDISNSDIISSNELEYVLPFPGIVISFNYPKGFKDENGGELWIMADTPIYLLETRPTIINKKYRIYVPGETTEKNSVFYFDVRDFSKDILPIRLESRDGLILGDLTKDGCIDGFDMILMRQNILTEEISDEQKALSDLNGDANVSVADAVLMQKFLLSQIQHFYE